MLLKDIQPFIRFADVYEYVSDRGYSKTYDCRFLYFMDGNGTVEVEQTEYDIKPHMLLTFQPGTLYHLKPKPAFSAVVLDFDYTMDYAPASFNTLEAFAPISPRNFNPRLMHIPIIFDDYPLMNKPVVLYNISELRRPLTDLLLEYNSMKLFAMEKSSLLFKNILLEVVRRIYSGSKSSRLAESVLDYIYLNYNQDLTNEKIGEVFHHDPCYLNRLVKSYTGMSLHKCLMQYRITTALKLLLTSDMPMETIAQKSGFYDTAHFSNTCKKLTGHPPSFYRNH